MDAIIVGGDHTKEELYDTKEKVHGNKFSLNLNNRYMGEYVLDALVKSKYIDKVVIVTDKTKVTKKFKYKKKIIFVHQVGKLTQNFLEAIKEVNIKDNRPVLVITADLPLITKDAVNALVKEYKKYDSDIFLGMVPYKNFKNLLGICTTNFLGIRVNNKLVYAEKVNGLIIKPRDIINNKILIKIVQIMYENREAESIRRQIMNIKFFPYILKNFGFFSVLQAIYLYLTSKFLGIITKKNNLYWLLPDKENFEKKISKKYKVNIGFVDYPELTIDCDTEEDKKNIEGILAKLS